MLLTCSKFKISLEFFFQLSAVKDLAYLGIDKLNRINLGVKLRMVKVSYTTFFDLNKYTIKF